MGRRERSVDPTDGPTAAFAVMLRKLREEAGGPAYRVMAARVHFSIAAVGDQAGQVALWDGSVRRSLGTLTPTSTFGAITALAFSSDASVLAAGTAGGEIQLWDTAARQPIGG